MDFHVTDSDGLAYKMLENEVAIVHIAPTGPPEKRAVSYSTTPAWYAPVMYTLADGRTFPGTIGPNSRKRDALESATGRDVTNMTALFDDDGKFYLTRTRYGMR